MKRTVLNENNIGVFRRFYRRYLSSYLLFRLIKKIYLFLFYSMRHRLITIVHNLRKFRDTLKQNSTPRLFYRQYLSSYLVFRLIKKLLFQIYFTAPIFFTKTSLVLRKKKQFHLTKMSSYRLNSKISAVEISQAETNKISGPKFIGEYPIKLHSSDDIVLVSSKLEVFELHSATVMGGVDLILIGNDAVHFDDIVPSRDLIRAELFEVAEMSPNFEGISISIAPSPDKRQCTAISLLGQCSGNYAHWLLETLPKLAIIDKMDDLKGLPLLIDEWIHPNFIASIKLISTSERPLIKVKLWESIHLDKVIEITPPSYIPFESRVYAKENTILQPDPSVMSFSKKALEKLREVAHENTASHNKKSFSPRLYLRRSSDATGQGRNLLNQSKVEELLIKNNFKIIDPGNLSFPEQVLAFKHAECIISPIGAALTNAIFAPPGCRVIALSPYYENASYYFFSNLMELLGHDFKYVLGPQESSTEGHVAHRNYSVDLEFLADALRQI